MGEHLLDSVVVAAETADRTAAVVAAFASANEGIGQ